ncbi:MAG: hypothetical protein LBH63_04415 [Clostridiales Family XIII bacterium]|jgi:hypothetical protein|nr:hypothetical protein [Clostridiales Family XIII bacterium]
MFAETEKKKDLLNARRPLSENLKDYEEALALFDLAYTSLKLDGSALTAEGVNRIIQGGIVEGVSLREHDEIESFRGILRVFADMLHMGVTLDRRELVRIYGVLTRDANPRFRSGSPILYHLDYTPTHYSDIPSALDRLFRELFARDYGGDCIRRAADMHDGIIAIYPFSERTETLAVMALQYELVRNGYPIAPLGLKDRDYNEMVANGIKSGDHDALYACVLDAVDQKIDLLLELSKDA